MNLGPLALAESPTLLLGERSLGLGEPSLVGDERWQAQPLGLEIRNGLVSEHLAEAYPAQLDGQQVQEGGRVQLGDNLALMPDLDAVALAKRPFVAAQVVDEHL